MIAGFKTAKFTSPKHHGNEKKLKMLEYPSLPRLRPLQVATSSGNSISKCDWHFLVAGAQLGARTGQDLAFLSQPKRSSQPGCPRLGTRWAVCSSGPLQAEARRNQRQRERFCPGASTFRERGRHPSPHPTPFSFFSSRTLKRE